MQDDTAKKVPALSTSGKFNSKAKRLPSNHSTVSPTIYRNLLGRNYQLSSH